MHDGLEFYAGRGRYLTVTGKVVAGRSELKAAPEAFEEMRSKHCLADPAAPKDALGNINGKMPGALAGFAETGNADLSNGAEASRWFERLSPEDQDACLAEGSATENFIKRADGCRADWLKIMMAFARSGAPNAREIGRGWSKRSNDPGRRQKYNEAEFEERFAEFEGTEGPITCGTLLKLMQDDGWDASKWKAKASQGSGGSQGGEGAQGAAVCAAGNFTSLMSVPHIMSENEAMPILNRCMFFAEDWGRKKTYGSINADGEAQMNKKQELADSLQNKRVVVRDDQGKEKYIPAFNYWGVHKDRNTVAKVGFWPQGRTANDAGERLLNLWTGFAVKPKRSWADVKLVHKHLLEIVCDGNKAHWKYLVRWLAHLIQRPWERGHVVPVLRSSVRGSGKTILIEWMKRIFGPHGIMISKPGTLVGRFTAHLENKCFVGVNEVEWSKVKGGQDTLKSLITDAYLEIEHKNGGLYDTDNILHIMFSTNADWAVPAGDGERRYFVLDVSPKRAGDRAYFNELYHRMEHGGLLGGLLHSLQKVKLDDFDIRDFPVTEALKDQQIISAGLETRWMLDQISIERQGGGQMDLFNVKFGTWVPTAELYASYLDYVKAHRRSGEMDMDRARFGKWLGKVGLANRTVNGRGQWYVMPVDACERLVRKQAGVRS